MARSPARSGSILLLLILAPLVQACGGPTVRYAGESFPPAVAASGVRQEEVLPHDHLEIGTVQASCQDERVQERGTRVRASLGCSEHLLHKQMRHRAAEVGGTLLIDPSCTSRVGETPEGDDDSGWVMRQTITADCVARVARPRRMVAGASASSPPPASGEKLVHVTLQGVPVEVLVRPVPLAPTPAPRPVEQVERSFAPATEGTLLAQLHSRCQKPCDRAIAEQALLHGAARAGAGMVTDVRCLSIRAGVWGCDGAAIQK